MMGSFTRSKGKPYRESGLVHCSKTEFESKCADLQTIEKRCLLPCFYQLKQSFLIHSKMTIPECPNTFKSAAKVSVLIICCADEGG